MIISEWIYRHFKYYLREDSVNEKCPFNEELNMELEDREDNKVVRKYYICNHYKKNLLISNSYTNEKGEQYQVRKWFDMEINRNTENIKNFVDKIKSAKGMFIYGKNGVGKSWTMRKFLSTMILKEKSVCWINFRIFSEQIKMSYGKKDFENNYVFIIKNKIRNYDIVVFDEFNMEIYEKWMRQEMFELLDSRINEETTTRIKTTFFLSNYPFKDFIFKSKESVENTTIFERIRGLCNEIFELNGNNIRKGVK